MVVTGPTVVKIIQEELRQGRPGGGRVIRDSGLFYKFLSPLFVTVTAVALKEALTSLPCVNDNSSKE